MSVSMNQFLIYGLKLPFGFAAEWEREHKQDFFDKFCDRTLANDLSCMYDGMNGEWIFVGNLVIEGTEGDMLGDPPIDVNYETHNSERFNRELLADIRDVFGDKAVMGDGEKALRKPALWLVTQYS